VRYRPRPRAPRPAARRLPFPRPARYVSQTVTLPARKPKVLRRPPVPAGPPDRWTAGERDVLRKLSTPARIQDYVDRLVYRPEDAPGSPRRVIAEQRANCYDGAIFAAAALRRLDHPPLLLDLWAVRDDDHVLAVFRKEGTWGAIAKSNFVGLRFREPIHRTLRELVLSYFEQYFNVDGEKTLRAWSARPLDLARFDRFRWTFRDDALQYVSDRLDALPHLPILTKAMERGLARVDARSLQAGMVGTLAEGLYQQAG
jgi:hypothetical protein